MARRISVQLIGDATSLTKAFNQAGRKGDEFDSKMGRAGSRLKTFAKAGVAGAAAGGMALVTSQLFKSVGAAKEAELAQARLEQAMQSAGVSQRKYGKQIEDVIQQTSRLAAMDDEELSDSFAQLLRSTGSVEKAMKGMKIAANAARARQVPLATATKAVEKAFLGSDTALRRLGITVPKVDKAYAALKQEQNALRDQLKGASDEEKKAIETRIDAIGASMKAARESDKMATALSAVDKAQRKFAGSGERYSKTLAGSHERFQVAVENLQESIGKHLVPVLTKLMVKGVKWIEWAEANWPRFAAKVREMWQHIKPIFDAFKQYLGGWVKIIQGIIEGDWSLVWKGVKQTVSAAFDLLFAFLRAVPAKLFMFGLKMGKQLAAGVLAGIGNLAEKIGNKLLPGNPIGGGTATPGPASRGRGGRQASQPRSASDPPGGGVLYAGPRARGGPALANRTYKVGEDGPEWLTMGNRSGNISTGGGGINIGTIVLPGVTNARQFLEELQRMAQSTNASRRGPFAGTKLAI